MIGTRPISENMALEENDDTLEVRFKKIQILFFKTALMFIIKFEG